MLHCIFVPNYSSSFNALLPFILLLHNTSLALSLAILLILRGEALPHIRLTTDIVVYLFIANRLKPIKEFLNKVTWVLSWKNPAATMLIFLVSIPYRTVLKK